MTLKTEKIYFLINSLQFGWAERVVVNLASQFSRTQDVTIITLKDDRAFDLPDGVRYIPLSRVKNNLLMLLLVPYYILRLSILLRQFSSGVSFLEISNFIHILAKKNAIISFRIHIDFFRGLIWSIYRWLIRQLYPRAQKIIVNSEENRHDLAEYLGIEIKKIQTIYNPVDIARIATLSEESIDESDLIKSIQWRRVYITVGRLVWQKHHEKIIQALIWESENVDRNFVWLIIWDGPEMEHIRRWVQESELSRHVIFLGSKKNVFKYLAISDFFLYASETEGFPNVLVEAASLGIPIITTDFKSGARELLLGSYDKNLNISKYPYYGSAWILLDRFDFLAWFGEIDWNLLKPNTKMIDLRTFDSETIMKQWQEVLSIKS